MTNRLPGGCATLMAALLCASPAMADLRISAERIDDGTVDARNISLVLSWPAGQAHGELELRAARVEIAEPALRFESLRWRCRLLRGDQGWSCNGPLLAKGIANSTLALDLSGDRLSADLSQAKARLTLSTTMDDGAPLRVRAQRLPADWLQPLLVGVWEDARLTSGWLDFDGSVRSDAQSMQFGGDLAVTDFGLDTRDGSIATAGLQAAGAIDVEVGAGTTLAIDLKLTGGELLAGSFYAELPSTEVGVSLDATALDSDGDSTAASGGWRVQNARWRDGAALDLSANGLLDPAAEMPLIEASIRLQSEDLALLTSRYAQSLLASAGLPAASANGGLGAELELQKSELRRLSLEWRGADVDSGDTRAAFTGLDGVVGYSASSSAETSQLRWHSARLYGVDLGSAELDARSVDSRVFLTKPLVLSTLGGSIRLQRLGWAPTAGESNATAGQSGSEAQDAGNQLELSMVLEGLDLAAVSEALDWPAFTGTLSGTVPSATYADDRLVLDGGLSASVFDGTISVDNLSIERPLGVAPTLAASIELNELDLQPLTEVFGFGEIEGRLNGRVDDLRMVDWSPAAFDARFETVDRKGVRRRISQRAVNDLSSVGGGPVAGLQAQLLGVFDSFGYRRIGLGCRLSNNVCLMSGIEGLSGSSGSGYTVVEGSGLPSITVNGFQRRVDWPVLVNRLQAISDGQAPRID